MIYLALPTDFEERHSPVLPFYLAMEEYAAKIIGDEDIFFMWQVNPTVIFGRNQLIENEVNLDYCKERGIKTFRRKSGGGCVYADRDNIMFSYITCSDDVALTFSSYTAEVAKMLRSLGLNATPSGRNDVMIDSRKVSGNAFYHLPGRSIVHGTMLFSTDMENMLNAITPSGAKLQSKGVESVKNHITTLSEHLDIDIETFKTYAKEFLTSRQVMLEEKDIAEIEKIEAEYLTQEFIFGNNPRATLTKNQRIENVGEIQTSVETKAGKIQSVNLAGDFFLLGALDEGLLDKLKGIEYTKEAIHAVLSKINLSKIIMNLKSEDLLQLLIP